MTEKDYFGHSSQLDFWTSHAMVFTQKSIIERFIKEDFSLIV